MNLHTIARPYAKAAYLLALETNAFDAWSRLLKVLAHLSQEPLVRSSFLDPALSGEQKYEMVASGCGQALFEQGKNYLRLLMSYKKLSASPHITAIFEQMMALHFEVESVTVFSRYDLSEAEKTDICRVMEKKLQKKTIQLDVQVDPSLLGGMMLKVGDRVMDGSIRGQLRLLQKHLLSG